MSFCTLRRHVLWGCEEQAIEPRFVLHDRDVCYSEGFDELLKNIGIEPVKTPYQAPNANAFAERWIRSLREECLNHLIIFGLDRLQYVLDQYKDYFNQHRPHQGIGNRIPARIGRDMEGSQTILDRSNGAGSVQYKQFLGGLLKSYSQKAA